MAKRKEEVVEVVTLGLDVGPNSVGWALVKKKGTEEDLVDAGVRVFPEGVENYGTSKQKPKNQDRRVARGQRRQVLRRKRRKLKLREALTRLGLLPEASSAEWIEALGQSPYKLRAKAVSEKLTGAELARVFLHLSQRRGFLSNRKSDRGRNEKETQGMLGEISELKKELDRTGKTLGQYLAAREAPDGEVPLPERHTLRRRHTHRAMLFEEFERIWTTQAKYHPKALTDQTRWGTTGKRSALRPHKPRAIRKGVDWLTAYGVEGILFFQRPMFWPVKMIGRCEYEPREYRCPRADRAFQLFKILSDVNHLRYFHPLTNDPTELSEGQREAAMKLLLSRESATFDQIRKAAKLDANCRFTIEKEKKTKLTGHLSDHVLRKAGKEEGLEWDGLPEGTKDAIVRLVADPRADDGEVEEKLVREYGLTGVQAHAVATAALPDEYANLSLKAIENLLPQLRRGLTLMKNDGGDSALHAAGYVRRDERKGETVDELPALDQIHTGPLSDLANPIVAAALHEVRKVVNLLVKTYGKPDRVHVELAREMKMGEKKRKEYQAKLAEREAERAAAADAIREAKFKPSRDAIERYLLWKEQGERCAYSPKGEHIGLTQLLGGEVEVDHILPWSQSLDDSMMNKVVCFRRYNQEKGQRTPHEWLAGASPEWYETVLQNARELPLPKRERFKREKVELEDFIARQLVDTGYISRLAVEYLGMLVRPKNVLGSKGKYTAELRWQWGLDTVLPDIPDSPAWQEVHLQAEEKEKQAKEARKEGREEEAEGLEKEARQLRENGLGEKNRADHRHHAIDAIVVALTDQSRLQQLSRIEKQGGTRTTGEVLEEPWVNFRRSILARAERMRVSHRVQRKVSGALHDETQYAVARVTDPELQEEGGVFAVRKPVVALTDAEIPRIRDRRIRELVQAKLGVTGGRAKKGSKEGGKKAGKKESGQDREAILANLAWPNGLPIRKVRITKPEKTIQVIREGTQPTYVRPGSTHHLCIFEIPRGDKVERDAVFVTMLEAARRVRDREPIIRREHPNEPGATFLMSLSKGELVELEYRGKKVLATYRTAASTQGQIYFAPHSDARPSAECAKLVVNCNTLRGRKVTVDPIGRVRWAND